MTADLLPVEAHQKWLHAFNWWYHSSNRDRMVANLREGVSLSPKNSIFLAAILDGSVKSLSGKQSGLTRFKNSIIDNKIHDLRAQGMKRDDILEVLKKSGLIDDHVAITGLHKRIDRPSPKPMKRHEELDSKFVALYDRVTAKCDN
jgi:hypothetical protein